MISPAMLLGALVPTLGCWSPRVQGHTEQSPGPAAPSSCSFLLAREADGNINFTEQQPPL